MSWEVYSHFAARGVNLARVIGVALSLVPMGFLDVQGILCTCTSWMSRSWSRGGACWR
jgi:hypothetical protein